LLSELFSPEAMLALVQVIAIDIALAGDNAIVVGMAAASLPPTLRRRAIVIGIVGATVFRIVFALFTTQLMKVVGLLFAGGILLLWVAWKLWRELRSGEFGGADIEHADGAAAAEGPTKTFREAVWQIIVADITMSLDNVIGVAGAARDHIWVLAFGLILSVALMGLAASFIARLLGRHPWLGYVGFLVILYVALAMVYEGGDVLLALF
jgi:YjbE family integral membrane protein